MCLWQQGVLEWLHLPHTQSKMLADYPYMCSLIISKGRQRSKEMFGYEPKIIVTPYNKNQIDQLMQHNEDWILSLQGFMGQISYHFPRHPLVEFAKHMEVIFSCQGLF